MVTFYNAAKSIVCPQLLCHRLNLCLFPSILLQRRLRWFRHAAQRPDRELIRDVLLPPSLPNRQKRFCFVLRHINHKGSFNAGSVFEVNWCYFIFYYIFGIFCGKIRGGDFFKHTFFHIFCLNIYYKYFFNIFWEVFFFFFFFFFLKFCCTGELFKYPSKFFWVYFIENLF